jgi:hypothetical protein
MGVRARGSRGRKSASANPNVLAAAATPNLVRGIPAERPAAAPPVATRAAPPAATAGRKLRSVAGVPGINPSPRFRVSLLLVSLLPGAYLTLRGDASPDFGTVFVLWLLIVVPSLAIDRSRRRRGATERLLAVGVPMEGTVIRTKEVSYNDSDNFEVTYEYAAGAMHQGKFLVPKSGRVVPPEVGAAVALIHDPDDPAVHAAFLAQPSLERPAAALPPIATSEPMSGVGCLGGLAIGLLTSLTIGIIAGVNGGAGIFPTVINDEGGVAVLAAFGGGTIALVVRRLRERRDLDSTANGETPRRSRANDIGSVATGVIGGVFVGVLVLTMVGQSTGWLPKPDCNANPDACQGGDGGG